MKGSVGKLATQINPQSSFHQSNLAWLSKVHSFCRPGHATKEALSSKGLINYVPGSFLLVIGSSIDSTIEPMDCSESYREIADMH